MAIVKAIMGDQTVTEALDEAAKKIDTILLQ
jgi:ABC-type glycerol-3-phosphate transport system substrate-binding protein